MKFAIVSSQTELIRKKYHYPIKRERNTFRKQFQKSTRRFLIESNRRKEEDRRNDLFNGINRQKQAES